MRRTIFAIFLIAAVAGCVTPKVTTNGTGDNQTLTMHASGGSITAGKNAVDPTKLGLPVYPGATTGPYGGISGASAHENVRLVSLKTSDSYDKVYAWYKAHMPANVQTMESTSGDASVGSFVEGKARDTAQRRVTITSSSDGTTIELLSATTN